MIGKAISRAPAAGPEGKFAYAMGIFLSVPQARVYDGEKKGRGKKKVERLKWTAGTGRKWIMFPFGFLGRVFLPPTQAGTQKWDTGPRVPERQVSRQRREQSRGPVVVVQVV